MELKYILLTIIKILISVPSNFDVDAAALMGGYMDNSNNTRDFLQIQVNSDGVVQREDTLDDRRSDGYFSNPSTAANDSEEIPDPSPLVIPGYNLPENIFNKGKPFYMEKDPLTGKFDFTNKTSSQDDDDEFYDYSEEEEKQSDDIFNKANIDRKDGSLGSHRPSDINQLSPNLHDFLNLPIKYNPDKYVYPLISNSYANTKVQGNVNKYHNHKTHITKYPTYKPPNVPYVSPSNPYNIFEYEDTTTTTTTNAPLTTKGYKVTPKPMSYPSFSEDFSDDYYGSSEKLKDEYDFKPKEVYKTTPKLANVFLTTTSSPPITTTRKIISLFEQLFGEYDETVSTTEKTKAPSLFMNLPSNRIQNTQKPVEEVSTTTQTSTHMSSVPNVATGSKMEMDNLYEEYDDYYYNNPKSSEIISSSTSMFTPPSTSTSTSTTTTTTSTTSTTTATPTTTHMATKPSTIYNSHSYREPYSPTTRRTEVSSEFNSALKITSLPLGDNHVTTSKIPAWQTNQHISESNNYHPVIIATQNLRDQLNNERVVPKPFSVHTQYAPSSSSIHIAPDQDTVSFVVGHHQKTDGGSYSTINSQDDFSTNYFQPLYGEGSYEKDDIIYKNSPDSVIFQQPQMKPHHEVSGSVVTIQTNTNSEASLSIGVPVENIKKIPGQVMDAKLELDNKEPESAELPLGGSKVVFPNEKEVSLTSLQPPLSTPNPPFFSQDREILKLASKPMYHQLPSDLTPPKEEEGKHPSRIEAPRPPWDPRPGHFFSGNLEYSRPPRPFPDVAFKRIDTLPNILPQFRPNMKSHGPMNGMQHPHGVSHGGPHGASYGIHRGPSNFYDNRLHREPLLERPSNHPLEFYEKLQPPPLPPKNLHNYRKIPPLPQVPQHLEQRTPVAQDRNGEEYVRKPPMVTKIILEPPKVMSNLKKPDGAVETLQMLQAKQSEKNELHQDPVNSIVVEEPNKTEKPVYVVYPVNTPPIKLDVIDTNKRESVVIGTRAELPLPPSEINKDLIQDQDPIIGMIDRNDSPILKPQSRPAVFPLKSDFPYPLERPDISVLHPVPDATSNGIGSEGISHSDTFVSNNQWNTVEGNIESRIVTGNKVHNHIFAEKPIAVAYTPTEPSESSDHNKYFIPPTETPSSNVYFVPPNKEAGKIHNMESDVHSLSNHRTEENINDSLNVRPEQDFQAPFQASVKVDSPSQGWSVIRRSDSQPKNTEESETTTIMPASTSEFDIEHFKPQLEGGFRPIYTFRSEDANTKVDERQE